MLESLTKWLRREPPAPTSPFEVAVRAAMKDVQAYARSHGGQIDLVSVDESGVVKVRFKGACAGCPMSAVTLRLGIEERLKELAPEVKQVIAV